MKFFFCASIILWTHFFASGQTLKIDVYEEKDTTGAVIFKADNNEYFSVTVSLKMTHKGVDVIESPGGMTVLAPLQKGKELVRLTPKAGQPWSYKSSFSAYMGDLTKQAYDSNFVYELPFEIGTSEIVGQGYFGKVSHQDEYALDFNMTEGTPIHASRSGLVVKMIENNDKSCPNVSCAKFNNLITIEHDDGTFADYAHLRKNGSEVEIHDQISQGQLIGYSGKTGWTTGPHLHFVVYTPIVGGRKTIPTFFRTSDSESELLSEGHTYSRK